MGPSVLRPPLLEQSARLGLLWWDAGVRELEEMVRTETQPLIGVLTKANLHISVHFKGKLKYGNKSFFLV